MAPRHMLYGPQCSGCIHSQFPAESDKIQTCKYQQLCKNYRRKFTKENYNNNIKYTAWKSCQGWMNNLPFLFIPISKGKKRTGWGVKELTPTLIPKGFPLKLFSFFGWSGLGSLIQDRSDNGASKELLDSSMHHDPSYAGSLILIQSTPKKSTLR